MLGVKKIEAMSQSILFSCPIAFHSHLENFRSLHFGGNSNYEKFPPFWLSQSRSALGLSGTNRKQEWVTWHKTPPNIRSLLFCRVLYKSVHANDTPRKCGDPIFLHNHPTIKFYWPPYWHPYLPSTDSPTDPSIEHFAGHLIDPLMTPNWPPIDPTIDPHIDPPIDTPIYHLLTPLLTPLLSTLLTT